MGGGGLMALATELMGLGLGMDQIQTAGKEVFAYAREVAGDQTVGEIIASIPACRNTFEGGPLWARPPAFFPLMRKPIGARPPSGRSSGQPRPLSPLNLAGRHSHRAGLSAGGGNARALDGARPVALMARVHHPDAGRGHAQALEDLANGADGLQIVFSGALGGDGSRARALRCGVPGQGVRGFAF